ncbi:MAG: CRISPR-associated endonuclease Cas1 [Candidatus Eisenbacteria bacterium]|nr:CRISPR-associated endonuclease Cas1 [Candidatus Eisenbacteria bacterium]
MVGPAFDRYEITLRLTAPARFHFCHGGALMGLLCRTLETHHLPHGVIPFPCESGRVRFDPGDGYSFGVTLAGDSRSLSDVLESGLARIGGERQDPDSAPPRLGGNFEVISFERLPPVDLDEESAQYAGGAMTLQFLSPLRLERPRDLIVRGARYVNAGCFPVEHVLQRLGARVLFLERGRYLTHLELEANLPKAPEGSTARELQLLWLDMPIEGSPRKDPKRPKGYTLGGVQGTVILAGVPEEWLPWLVLGQYLHVGGKSHFGFGRYRIVEPRSRPHRRFRPARSLLAEIADQDGLERAVEHIRRHSVAAGMDGETPEGFSEDRSRRITKVITEISSRRYKPSPLLGCVIPKSGSRVRPLAIPTMKDRVLQRAACEALGPAIDVLLEDCSYAYRKGFSRAGAARAIEQAYSAGYRYVLDADIESFFDAVDWKRMFAKLDALFPQEPLVELIRAWIQAPVVFDGTTIRRKRGLPQGCPVSPLLANLFLDEFDEELLGKDYRLVRYADDFVVLCKDLESARRARGDAAAALAELGLQLSEEKTSIRSFDQGFSYLGYLFCRSVVFEKEKVDEAGMADLEPAGIPEASWLAQVPFEKVRALVRGGRKGRKPAALEVVPLAPAGAAPADQRRPLYVTSHSTRLRVRKETLEVLSDGGEHTTIPLRTLSHVVLVGSVRVTVSALRRLAGEGVPVYFCSRGGTLQSVMGRHAADWKLWTAQASLAEDFRVRVQFAREIVMAKLHNQATLAVRFKLAGAHAAAEEIRALERGCRAKTTLDALRGLEGRGSSIFFGAMARTLPDSWGFQGRKAHPPPDPVNALLSFGYTMLYNHIRTDLVVVGLNPRVGLYHQPRGTYAALACDLEEEFRHLVEALVLSMIRRREIVQSDFVFESAGPYPCLMTPDARRRFIAAFERRLALTFTPPDGVRVSYRRFMDHQARRARSYVAGHGKQYMPLRIRS